MPLLSILCPWILHRGAGVTLRRAWADGDAGTGDIPTIDLGYFEAPGSDQPLFTLLLLPQGGGFLPEVNIIISRSCRVLLKSLSADCNLAGGQACVYIFEKRKKKRT